MYLIFDGGNGGVAVSKGYGSFKVYARKHGELLLEVQEHQFDGAMTSNEAEYHTLILALEHINRMFPTPRALIIEGDSELVRSQVLGVFKVKKPHLQVLRSKVLQLLGDIPYTYKHIPRAEVVAVFGH